MTPRTRKPAAAHFDPYGILRELDEQRVSFILIGGVARVLHGTSETPRNLDLVPRSHESTLRRLAAALAALGAERKDGKRLDVAGLASEPFVELTSSAGLINVAYLPAGTRGYDDLRYRATREHLGEGLRVAVASSGDLARMLETRGHETRGPILDDLRRITELDRAHGRGIGR